MIEERILNALREIEAGNRGMTFAHNEAAFKRAHKRGVRGWEQLEAVRQELEEKGLQMVLEKGVLHIGAK